MEMENIYYYKMKKKGDDTPPLGNIPCKSIVNVEILTEHHNYGFVIDSGKKKYEFSTSNLA